MPSNISSPQDERINMMQQQTQQQQRSQPMQRRSQPPLTKSKSTQPKHGKKNRISQNDNLSLLVIPMEQDREIYQIELKINGKHSKTLSVFDCIGNETSLKQVFDAELTSHWMKVFKGHSPKEPPTYRLVLLQHSTFSLFRKPMSGLES